MCSRECTVRPHIQYMHSTWCLISVFDNIYIICIFCNVSCCATVALCCVSPLNVFVKLPLPYLLSELDNTWSDSWICQQATGGLHWKGGCFPSTDDLYNWHSVKVHTQYSCHRLNMVTISPSVWNGSLCSDCEHFIPLITCQSISTWHNQIVLLPAARYVVSWMAHCIHWLAQV